MALAVIEVGGSKEYVHSRILSTSSCVSRSFRPVVELGRARALMRRHFLRVLERAAIGEVSSDSGGAERVAADFRRDAGSHDVQADSTAERDRTRPSLASNYFHGSKHQKRPEQNRRRCGGQAAIRQRVGKG